MLSASGIFKSAWVRATVSPGIVLSLSPAESSAVSMSASATESQFCSGLPERFLKPQTATEVRPAGAVSIWELPRWRRLTEICVAASSMSRQSPARANFQSGAAGAGLVLASVLSGRDPPNGWDWWDARRVRGRRAHLKRRLVAPCGVFVESFENDVFEGRCNSRYDGARGRWLLVQNRANQKGWIGLRETADLPVAIWRSDGAGQSADRF